MAQPIQLAPGSLALVLSPREAGQATEKRGGRALFRAFRRANARCFWNERLAHAASRLAFLGWLQRRVLLVRAPQPCVQVLRDAWRRRALRSPRGFRITAVGAPAGFAVGCLVGLFLSSDSMNCIQHLVANDPQPNPVLMENREFSWNCETWLSCKWGPCSFCTETSRCIAETERKPQSLKQTIAIARKPPWHPTQKFPGDVFPVQMNPIAQCRFVPLAEVLCCTIAEMNAAQVAVTRESLLEHLRHYPGIAVPSPDILHSTLGTLIQERKIYHTGEGYYIVTPNTYFVTKTATQGNKRALLSDEGCLEPTSVTYLVSVDCCAELAQEDEALVAHCPSCQCFLDTSMQDSKDPLSAEELTRKNQEGLEKPTPLSKNQVLAASEDTHIWMSPKPLPFTKDKGKKFGFGFLWRSLSRREKPKTEYRSFSAQFPPEEWPVRDEGSSNNIPRDVEHAIIKRINPVLTVDNLIRHTVLMQKYDEQKKYNSQGTSTDVPPTRHKCSPKEGIQKRQGWFAKPHRRGSSHRSRRKAWSQGNELEPGLEKHPKVSEAQPATRMKSPSKEIQQLHDGKPAMLGAHLIYKKQISNPFQGMCLRGHPVSKGHSVQKSHGLKLSPVRPEKKPFPRAGSSGPLGVFDAGAKGPFAEQRCVKLETETRHMMKAPVHPVSDFRSGSVDWPSCSVLPHHPRCCSFRESMLRGGVCDGESRVIPEILRKSYSDCDMFLGTKETHQVLPSLDSASRLYPSVDKTVHQFQTLDLLDCPVGANHLKTHERQDGDSAELMRKAFVPGAKIVNLESEGFSHSEQAEVALNQSDPGVDDGACSSLYLSEDFSETDDDSCHTLPGHTFVGGGRPNHLGRPTVRGRSLTEWDSTAGRFEPLALEGHWYKAGLFANSGDGSNPDLTDSPGLNSGTPFGFDYERETTAACVQASAAACGSLLKCSTARKVSCGAEILQDSPADAGVDPAGWRQSPPNQETEKHFPDKSQLLNTLHVPVLTQEPQREHSRLEGTESYSMTGDSGIDSPRTQSLASNNSAVLDGFKRRQNFLQNYDGIKTRQTLTSSSLLQLTPVINV